MDSKKFLKAIGGMLLMADKEPNIDGWVKSFLNEVKITLEDQQYKLERLTKENDSLCDKLADIRNLFDESDMKAEGHGMEDAIASPYAVACYAENKIIRLMKENKELQEELDKWISEFMI